MPIAAILFEPASAATTSTVPLSVGGIGVLERQVRQVMRAGVSKIIVMGMPELSLPPGDAIRVGSAEGLRTALDGAGDVMMVAPGLVLDERIIRAMTTAAAPAIATWPATSAKESTSASAKIGVERIDSASLAAGIELYPVAMVLQTAARLGSWDLLSTLRRTALVDARTIRVDLAALPLYAAERRREVPILWALPDTVESANAVTTTLLAAAQKGCLDWPARFIHPPVENAAVRLLLPTPITPNMITVLNVVVALAAGIAFANGWMWTGLVLALICGPLDGIDGKLARTRLEFSRFGDLEHVLDKVAEYGWYLAIAAHFAAVSPGVGPWAIAALLIGFAFAESLQGEFYRRFTGSQLDDAGPFERRFRVFGARRNTLYWTWVPFAAAGLWYPGFVFLAAYAVITYFVMQFRFFVRLGTYGRANSSQIDVNFVTSAYEFLARPASNTQQAVND